MSRQYNHYFRPCPYTEIDLYRAAKLFQIYEPELFHAFKKIVVAGKRGSKSNIIDIIESVDSLLRGVEMYIEDVELHGTPFPDHLTVINGKLHESFNALDRLSDRVAALLDRITRQNHENAGSNAGTANDQPEATITLQATIAPPAIQPQQGPEPVDDIYDEPLFIEKPCPICHAKLMANGSDIEWCSNRACSWTSVVTDIQSTTCTNCEE